MFIAEIGLNHRGNKVKALRMLKKLVKTDIDAVTFQIPKPGFYKKNKSCSRPLTRDFYRSAINFVHENNRLIGFAIADKKMIPFLNKAGADFWKTLSMDIFNNALMKELQKTNKLIFISTGIANESEILKLKKMRHIKFIHTQLSHKEEDVNLKAITRLKKLTNQEVAFGLHCSNLYVPYLAVAFEPSDMFFYVKDRLGEKVADDEHAIVIDRLNEVLRILKTLEKSIGTGKKEKIGVKLK